MMADGSASCFSAILYGFHGRGAQAVVGVKHSSPRQRRPYHGMDSGRSQVIHHSGINMFKAHRVPLNLVRYQLPVYSFVKTVEFMKVKVGDAHLPNLSFHHPVPLLRFTN